MNNIKNFKNFNTQDIFTYIANDDIQLVKNYINANYNLNIKNDYGHTPLMYAVLKNSIEIVKLLLNAGADVNDQDNDGYTALIWATHNSDNKEIVKLLLNAGADIDKQNDLGNTALISVSIRSKIKIAKFLLNSGADIDKQNNNGNTALISAAFKNNKKIIELLLDYGAAEFILNAQNKSFYDFLNTENKEYFTQNYPTSVYNAISHWYKKSFTEFVKDYNIKIKNNK